MESLGKALTRLDIRTRRPPLQIDRNTLENQIRKIFFWVWNGKPAAVSRAQMCTLLKQTEGLMTAVENSRRALGLPKSRAKNPHRRLQYLLQHAGMKLKVARQRKWIQEIGGGKKTREWFYTLKFQEV